MFSAHSAGGSWQDTDMHLQFPLSFSKNLLTPKSSLRTLKIRSSDKSPDKPRAAIPAVVLISLQP